MNFRSFNLAYETSLVIDSEELAREVEKHFDELYKKTVPITEAMAEAWQTFANWPRFAVGFFGG
jgi:cardiolipin synthase